MLKSAKQAGIKQAIYFHVMSGYLAQHKQIQWEGSEYIHPRHPQCIELTDEEDKINYFMDANKDQLFDTDIIVVKNEIVKKRMGIVNYISKLSKLCESDPKLDDENKKLLYSKIISIERIRTDF